MYGELSSTHTRICGRRLNVLKEEVEGALQCPVLITVQKGKYDETNDSRPVDSHKRGILSGGIQANI